MRGYIVLVVVDGEGSGVEAKDDPAISIVEVDGLDPGGPLHHFLFDF